MLKLRFSGELPLFRHAGANGDADNKPSIKIRHGRVRVFALSGGCIGSFATLEEARTFIENGCPMAIDKIKMSPLDEPLVSGGITAGELADIFGKFMPLAALDILADASLDVATMRARLVEMAGK